MAEDIVPGLIERMEEAFRKEYDLSGEIQGLLGKVKNGTATYREAQQYALEVHKITGSIWRDYVSSEGLPDGRMYYNIASRLIPSSLDENYQLVADYTETVQQALNQKASIGLKAQRPAKNQDRIDGLVEMAAEAEAYDDIKATLDSGMENFVQNIVDESVRINAGFQASAGLEPKVIRSVNRPCCKWCAQLAGVYDYDDVYEDGNDVWRRHRNCDCLIEYDPGSGKRKRVENYRFTGDRDPAKIETRKRIQATDDRSEERIRERKWTGPEKVTINDKQFGKKYGKHAEEFGLDPSNETDRTRFRGMIYRIFGKPDEIRMGDWRGQEDPVLFYIKGNDVVLTKQDGTFISILKGGISNARVKNAGKPKI